MLKFLQQNFRPWLVVVGRGNDPRYISDPATDLDYSHRKAQIGFDYQSGWGIGDSIERAYYYAVLRWIALQVGQKRLRFNREEFPGLKLKEAVPCIYYDCDPPWPVFLDRPEKPFRWCWVDRLGVPRDKTSLIEHHLHLLYARYLEQPLPKEKGKKGRVFKLREDAAKLLGRPIDMQDFMGLNMPVVTHEERIMLVKRLLGPELRQLIDPIRAEMKRLNTLWRN